jgi:hypothetical protein
MDKSTADGNAFYDFGEDVALDGEGPTLLDSPEKVEIANKVAVGVGRVAFEGYRNYFDGILKMLGRYYSDEDLGALASEGFDALAQAAVKRDLETGELVWIDHDEDDGLKAPLPM